uniref:Thiamine biosynthesis protein S n=1 Tax=Biddulphia biddulphiana TaxID=1158022 RepID=A0A2U9NSH5_9STRA|nr:thiamine biosynthesis protein S [Biddulphia biddulphiana]AWT40084.1 thiamine biosynthesis protein S [Biddulphia biddulphiana]
MNIITKKTFYLNGEEYFSKDNLTLLDLLDYFDFNLSLSVLEYNNFICHKKHWNNISIRQNDKIEIITIVGGG